MVAKFTFIKDGTANHVVVLDHRFIRGSAKYLKQVQTSRSASVIGQF